jgi:hypothetical protein
MKQHWTHLEDRRQTRGDYATQPGDLFGQFIFSTGSRGQERLLVVACQSDPNPQSPAHGWEHVSVSAWTPSLSKQGKPKPRTPTWAEMDRIKHKFWEDDETVIQFHPAESEKVNIAANCLHLWKYTLAPTLLPPSILV